MANTISTPSSSLSPSLTTDPLQQLQKRLLEETKRRGRIVPPSENQMTSLEELLKNSPGFEWFNTAQKNLAKRRIIEAQALRVPYIAASSQEGPKTYLFDAMMALDALDGETSHSKNFNSSGKEWIHSPDDMKFKAYFFEDRSWLELGSIRDLEAMGLSEFTISGLLSASAALSNYSDDDPEYDEPRAADKEAIRAKIIFWSLLDSSLLPDASRFEKARTLDGVEKKHLDQLLLDSIAVSSTDDLLILNCAIRNNINVNRKSEKYSCLPVTYAALQGCREAVEKLLPLSASAALELDLVRKEAAFLEEKSQVEWYLSLFSQT